MEQSYKTKVPSLMPGTLLFSVGLLGFEPRRTESKSVVLPLHYNPIIFPQLFIEGAQK